MLELLAALLASMICDGQEKNRPDPYKAAGIAYGLKGGLSDKDITDMGALLGTMGAFDDRTEQS